MRDIIAELERARRTVGEPRPGARTVALRRTYDAAVEDVWDACTDPERISRWFLPVTGDLRLGGHYQLEGNARGEIRECSPPHRLAVTWIFGEEPAPEDVGVVTVELSAIGEERTELALDHTGVVDPEFWAQYGPGATGVGWDLGLLGLALHLAGEPIGDPSEFESSPEARAFAQRSSREWGAAHESSGAAPAEAREAAARTSAFYAPEPADAEPRT